MVMTSSSSSEKMTTVSEVLETLRKRGYVEDFRRLADSLECERVRCRLKVEDFEIDQSYRFEGDSDPSDMAVVYAISSPNHHLKGVLVDAYGTYSDPMTEKMAK